jgi:Protein of unknown function (DUF3500)
MNNLDAGGMQERVTRRKTLALVAAVACAPGLALGQQDDRQERWRERSRQLEEAALAEPFAGVTADGQPLYGLFPIASTGVSTDPVVSAARHFLAALSAEQRQAVAFPVDDPEWRKWMNQHSYVRQGVSFSDMEGGQRNAALGLLQASLSARGLTLTRDIMRLNHTLGELDGNNFEEFDEWLYWITIMGEPSGTEPWGWQLDGHHAVINYFVLGDQVVMSPAFFGSEPVKAESGKYAGTEVLQAEQEGGLALLRGLTAAQRKMAVIGVSKDGNNNLAEAFRDNIELDNVGLPGVLLDREQRTQLLLLIERYVGNLRDDHAEVKMSEVEAHLDRTYFAWIGGTGDDSVFYYRIFSPVILIEFDHQKPVNLKDRYAPGPNRQHIHTVIRTPNGNDYGRDLLRQHYEQHPHEN